MQKDNESKNIGEKINDFVQKNRKSILVSIGVISIILIAFIVFLYMQNNLHNKAIIRIEELNQQFTELKSQNIDGSMDQQIEALLPEITSFAKGKSGYPGSKAWSIIGTIYGDKKQWADAEEAYLNAAKAGAKTFLCPISYYNASVAAQEQGKFQQAIEYLESSIQISEKIEFPAAPRAQFTIGRLYEQTGNVTAAIDAYRTVLIRWPNITIWANLAQSRIIALEISPFGR